MRVLLLNQFYPPDVAPTGRLLHDVAATLAERGHAVEVVCSRRRYDGGGRLPARESRDGVAVSRVPAAGFGRGRSAGRALDYVSYALAAAGALRSRRGRIDLALALTTPPLLGLVAARALRGSPTRVAHWSMDLYPDALVAAGALAPDGRAFRHLRRLARAQHRGARLALALGPFLERRLRAYLEETTRSAVVAPWGGPEAEAGACAGVRAERGWGRDDLVLLYSGNMGRAHRFGEFLQAAAALGPRGPVWAFAGGGARRPELERWAASGRGRVALLPYADESALPASLGAADVHLASLAPSWQGVVVPSKVPAAMAAGRPVIFVGPDANEAADWVKRSGGGWCVGEGRVAELLDAVRAAANPEERGRRAAAARRFAARHFDRRRNCEAIAEQLEACAAR